MTASIFAFTLINVRGQSINPRVCALQRPHSKSQRQMPHCTPMSTLSIRSVQSVQIGVRPLLPPYRTMELNSQYSPPESSAAAGSVNTHAIPMFRIVARCNPLWFAAIVPATLELSTCVVDTGNPYVPATRIVAIATSCAEAPCAYVMRDLPIFSPTVVTIRFHPIIVPNPSASATATFTHVGMNFVDLLRKPW